VHTTAPQFGVKKLTGLLIFLSGGFFVNQFYNLSNMEAHYNTTGPGRSLKSCLFVKENSFISSLQQKYGETQQAKLVESL